MGPDLRDGYGQTETTAAVGNTPGSVLKPGSMGRPLPGVPVVLVDPLTGERLGRPGAGEPPREGELCLDLTTHPLPLMTGYQGDPERNDDAMAGGVYHTGDVATLDSDGYFTYVGRTDDVFKASDYKVSPFEVESVLIEHPAVVEAAVVPAPDEVRLAVPKAYVVLRRRVRPGRRHRAQHPRPLPRAPRAVAAGPPHRVLRAAEDDLRQDPAGRAAGPRGGAGPRRRCPGGHRVPRRDVPRPQGLTVAPRARPGPLVTRGAGSVGDTRSGHGSAGDERGPQRLGRAGAARVAGRVSMRAPLTIETSS